VVLCDEIATVLEAVEVSGTEKAPIAVFNTVVTSRTVRVSVPIQQANVLRIDVINEIFHNDAEPLKENASMLYVDCCPPGSGENNVVNIDDEGIPCDVEHTSEDEAPVSASVSVEPTVDSAHTAQDVPTTHNEQLDSFVSICRPRDIPDTEYFHYLSLSHYTVKIVI